MKVNSSPIDSEGTARDQLVRVPNLLTDRSGTFRLMSWWQQGRVEAAKVMVVGAGALGNEVIKNLSMLGVGNLFIVDRDIVELANLGRSVLFRESDEGYRKVDVAARQARELNPQVRVAAFHGDLTIDLGLGVFRRMDVVIGCLDSRRARKAVNDACWLTDKPWIDGAIQELFGEVRVFVPGNGACYCCTLTDLEWTILRESRPCKGLAIGNILEGKVPTTPTISSIIGAIQCQEALKIIHDMPHPAGKSFVFRGLTTDADLLTLYEDPDCLSHFTYPEIVELREANVTNTTFKELLAEVKAFLGHESILSFRHREIVTYLRCPSCGDREELCLFEQKLTPDHAPCTACGYDMREPETTHIFTGHEPFADMTLHAVGVPPLDIVDGCSRERTIGFEISGDETEIVRFD